MPLEPKTLDRLKEQATYGIGVYSFTYLGVWSMTGLEATWNGAPAQAAGLTLLGFAGLYGLAPILRDFGGVAKRWERKSKKTFVSAQGERTITVNKNGQSFEMSAPLVRGIRDKLKRAQVNTSPASLPVETDVFFTVNGHKVPGQSMDYFLKRGNELYKSGATRWPYSCATWQKCQGWSRSKWERHFDILQSSAEILANNTGVVFLEGKQGKRLIDNVTPGKAYVYCCMALLPT